MLICDDAGCVIIAWNDVRKGDDNDYDVYAQKVDAEGNILWAVDGIPVCNAQGDQGFPAIISDGKGGAFMTWEDNRDNYDTDLYIMRVPANGRVGNKAK